MRITYVKNNRSPRPGGDDELMWIVVIPFLICLFLLLALWIFS